MPFTPAQFARGANYSLETYERKEPIDQINFQHALLDWLMKNKKPSTFGNGIHKEPVYYTNDSNAQNYFGADQVTYNERDPARWTDFPYYNLHDGFWFDEDRLLAAGITIVDGSDAIPTAREKEVLIDLLDQSYRALKNSMQEHLAFEFYRDGSQSTKAAPGLESLIDWTPATGVVGGIDAAVDTWWQNNADIGSTPADIVDDLENLWKDCIRYGGQMPTAIFAGQAWHDNFRTQAGQTINRQIHNGGNLKGGVTMDPSTNALFFHGVQVVWDPTLDALDALLATTTRSKTAYLVNDKNLSLRPVKGNWMVNRRPERLPDRYVHYFAKTSKYGLTVNKRNALAVSQIT